MLSVELKAAIYEGSANADLRLQLSQLVLHGLLFISARQGKITRTENKQRNSRRTRNSNKTEPSVDLQVSDRFAESLPLHHVVPGLLEYELGSS